MTTRPTTDGDTAIERVREFVTNNCDEPAVKAAFERVTTRISEQEVELERARSALQTIADHPMTHSGPCGGSSTHCMEQARDIARARIQGDES